MVGNVYEFVEDCFHTSYLGAPVDGSAWSKDCALVKASRVIKGGAWLNKVGPYLTAHSREAAGIDVSDESFGVRCAKTAK